MEKRDRWGWRLLPAESCTGRRFGEGSIRSEMAHGMARTTELQLGLQCWLAPL